MKLEPNDPDYPLKYGDYCNTLNDYDSAKISYIQAMELKVDDDEDIRFQYGACFRDINEYELAMNEFKRCWDYSCRSKISL